MPIRVLKVDYEKETFQITRIYTPDLSCFVYILSHHQPYSDMLYFIRLHKHEDLALGSLLWVAWDTLFFSWACCSHLVPIGTINSEERNEVRKKQWISRMDWTRLNNQDRETGQIKAFQIKKEKWGKAGDTLAYFYTCHVPQIFSVTFYFPVHCKCLSCATWKNRGVSILRVVVMRMPVDSVLFLVTAEIQHLYWDTPFEMLAE